MMKPWIKLLVLSPLIVFMGYDIATRHFMPSPVLGLVQIVAGIFYGAMQIVVIWSKP